MLVVSCSNTTSDQGSKNKSDVSFEKFGHSLASYDDLKEVAEHLNQRHRASKRAQKQCSELYLLMYLQKHAEAQYALVLEILERGLVVFVPKYDLRGFVNLQGKNGNAILPLDKDETTCDTYNNDVNGSQFQQYKLRHESQCISILDSFGNVLHEYRLIKSIIN
jgi:exoribonuclease R